MKINWFLNKPAAKILNIIHETTNEIDREILFAANTIYKTITLKFLLWKWVNELKLKIVRLMLNFEK